LFFAEAGSASSFNAADGLYRIPAHRASSLKFRANAAFREGYPASENRLDYGIPVNQHIEAFRTGYR
jgi:hypothetical protein